MSNAYRITGSDALRIAALANLTIDLTSPAKARAYLESLGPDTIIELPAAGKMWSAAADAVGVLAEQDASVFAREFGRWEWTVADVLEALTPEQE